MKKLLLLFAFLLLSPTLSFANTTYTRNPSGPDVGPSVTITWSFDDISDYGVSHVGDTLYYVAVDSDDIFTDSFRFPTLGCLSTITQKSGSITINAPADVAFGGIAKGFIIDSFDLVCESGDHPTYIEGNGTDTIFIFSESAPNSLSTTIDSANTSFNNTVGFTISNATGFMATQILLVIGTGQAVLNYLLLWIVALIAIGAIVYFLYRAFRYFRQ